jgi:hypothetical protein
MHIVKKLLIVLIIVASFVIIYRLLKENTDFKTQIDKQLSEPKKEGFAAASKVGDPASKAEAEKLNNEATALGRELTLSTVSKKYLDFPLREFMIKSSYNSAIINKTASTDAIEFVLSRGCRLVDFEIYTRNFENAKDTEFVSYSDDPDDPKHLKINTGLTLTLEKAMLFVAANAFSALSPLPNDPIFIHLRFKDNSAEAYNRTSKMLINTFGDRLYKNPVTGSTPIKEIMGKVVIIFDAMSSPKYYKFSTCSAEGTDLNCVPFSQYVALISGTADLPKYSYTSYYDLTQTPLMVSSTERTDVMRFIMVTPPDVGGKHATIPSKSDLLKLPVQMLLMQFHKQTEQLKKYEKMFNDCKSAFCPLGPFIRG